MIQLRILVVAFIVPASVSAAVLLESSCMMKLTFPRKDPVTLETAFSIETAVSEFFDSLLLPVNNMEDTSKSFQNRTADKDWLADVYPLKFYVDVTDSIIITGIASVAAAVTLLYESSEKIDPVNISTVLSEALGQTDLSKLNFPFSTDATQATFGFVDIENGTITLNLRKESKYSPREVGLIVVTSFLSVVLVVVSSVLLCITGGWKIFIVKLTNCLFEEVDEEDEDPDIHIVASKSTFAIQQSEDDEDDRESHVSSAAPSSASGILGVARNRDHPAAGRGFLSPDATDDVGSSMMYGDGTPVSRSNNLPLGITSMRKLQPSEGYSPDGTRGGFSGMVMQRLSRSVSKKF